MPRFSVVQRAFSAGEVSPYIHSRPDMEVFYGALARSVNFIPDQHGSLHRRPGTRCRGIAKAKPCLYDIDGGEDCPAVIVATPKCFSFYVDDEVLGDELEVPYSEDDYCDLKMVDDCGATFIVHPNYPPKFILKEDGEFVLKDFPRLPYDELNADLSCRLCVSAGGTSSTGNMTIATDEFASGDSVDIVDVSGTTLGTAVLGSYIGNNTFETSFITGILSGEYFDQNGEKIFVQSSGAIVEAIGCEPFTESMVGQYLRILDEEGVCQSTNVVETFSYTFVGRDIDDNFLGDWEETDDGFIFVGVGLGNYTQDASLSVAEDDETSNESNTWLSLQIIDFVSPTEVVIAYSGCQLKCTNLFCLPAYSDGVYPSSVWIFEDRLWFGQQDSLVGSGTGNFYDWEKTDPDGTVNPDNAIYTSINDGKCHDIQWLRSIDRYLIAGSDQGVYAFSGSNGAIQPDTSSQQRIQASGVSDVDPIMVQNQLLYVDHSCKRIFSLSPSEQYDQIGYAEHTKYADHIVESGIRSISFQEGEFPIVWVVTEDNCLSSFTYWPSQQVRGWSRHELGGFVERSGCRLKPEICSVKTQRSTDGKRAITYFAVMRSINGDDVNTIETLGDFFSHETKREDAHYLDAATRLETPIELPVVDDWRNQTIPSEIEGRIAICDDERWYYATGDGTILSFDAPNTRKARHGRTLVEREGQYEKIERTKYGEKPAYFGNNCLLFDPPCVPEKMVTCQRSWGELSKLEGETLVVYGDGQDCGEVTVVDGEITAEVCVGWVGYPYVSEVETLPWRANLGVTDGANDPSLPVRVSVDVYRTPSLWAVNETPNAQYQISESCRQLVSKESEQIWGQSFYSGWVDVAVNGTVGRNDKSGYILRADGPYPAIIRSIEAQFVAHGGQ